MIVWLNGAFGAGKTAAAYELHRRLERSFVYDPENVGYFLRENMPQECRTAENGNRAYPALKHLQNLPETFFAGIAFPAKTVYNKSDTLSGVKSRRKKEYHDI